MDPASPDTLALVALLGLLAGAADYGLGVGFGVVATPFLVAVLGFDPREAAAAVCAAQLLSTPAAMAFHGKRGNLPRDRGVYVTALTVSLVAGGTAAVAALLMSRVPSPTAYKVYGAGLVLLAILFVLGSKSEENPSRPGGAKSLVAPGAAGALAGAGKAVVGAGFSPMIVLAQSLSGVDIKSAVAAMPLAKLAPLAVILAIYGATGFGSVGAALSLAVGALASTPLASRILRRVPGPHLRIVIAAALAFAALKVLIISGG